MKIDVRPLPEFYRKFPKIYWPCPPPVFSHEEPTPAEIELARELFMLLDDESKEWYGRCRVFKNIKSRSKTGTRRKKTG